MCGQQGQEPAALLRQPLGVDLDEPQLGAQALAGTEDQLRNRVLLHPDELADLGVGPLLELAQGEHEPLARLEPRVRDSHLLLLAGKQEAPLRVVLDRRRQRGLRYLRDGLLPLPALHLLEEEVAQGREQVRRDLRRLRVEPVETRHGADERLLDEVVRVVHVAGQSVGERAAAGAGTRRTAPPMPCRSRARRRRRSSASGVRATVAIG